MAHRPGFLRHDTDSINLTPIQTQSEASGSANIFKNTASTGKKGSDGDTVNVTEEPIKPDTLPGYESPDSQSDIREGDIVVTDAKDIVTTVLAVEDDPSLSPWTFRMFFLGIGLAVFGSVLQEIFYFKPQTIFVSPVFLTVIAYVLGEGMSFLIPRKGRFLKFLNPFPFNLKEHAAIALMASAGSQSAQSTQALAAQKLFYGSYPSVGGGIFITLSTQLIGFGLAGMMRQVLTWPTRMLWPYNLPSSTLLESLHRDRTQAKRKVKIFYVVFFLFLVWELFPEYFFPVLEGVSIFCLANQNSQVFTNLFGGAQGNEGLGFLSICFDWQYIASTGSPLWLPFQTLANSFVGYLICIVLFMGLYYGNIWRSQDFPFLSQLLYDATSNSTSYVTYNTSAVLNAENIVDKTLLEQNGYPYLTGTYIGYMITSNMGFVALIVHQFLFNYDDVRAGWEWASWSNLKRVADPSFWRFWNNEAALKEQAERHLADPKIDPHYKLMIRNGYKECPQWWYAAVFLLSFIVGMVCLYEIESTLPWWAFIVALLLLTLMTLFFSALYGTSGFQFNVQPVVQMIGGYLCPYRPIANMYFCCYTYQALQQGQVLSRDLKLAQFVHLSPRATFTVQVLGCTVGALFNFVMMLTIVESQAPILTSIEGTNIWSGQNIQSLNTLAISWSIAKELFSVGGRYQWVTLSFLFGFVVPLPFYILHKITKRPFFTYWNMSIILWYAGYLFVGMNASIGMYFAVGFFAQYWLRKFRPHLFNNYNYIVSAGLDGGTQVLVFILTFAVFGGSGKARPFPTWAGNPSTDTHNIDYCQRNPALG